MSTPPEETPVREGDPEYWLDLARISDLDALARVAGEGVVQRGVAYWLDGRVRSVRRSPYEVTASVDGSRPGAPYYVRLRSSAAGLDSECSCPYDTAPVCKHVVAAIVEASSRAGVAVDSRRIAAEREVMERRRRGRSRVQVEHVDGDPWFGRWLARSSPEVPGWIVQIRSLDDRVNTCECPDFAVNQLGTCKHVEAVLHRVRLRWPEALAGARREALRRAFLHVVWTAAGPRADVHFGRESAATLRQGVGRYLEPSGAFDVDSPEAEGRLARLVMACPGLWVGDDVRRLVAERRRDRQREVLQTRLEHEWKDATHSELLAAMYPFQRRGAAFLAARGRAALADEPGLGKSLQAIVAASWLRRHEGVGRVLIVAPVSLFSHWRAELGRWVSQVPAEATGTPSARRAAYESGADYVLVDYDHVAADELSIESLVGPDLLIVDEAERVADWESPMALAVRRLAARRVFALTGVALDRQPERLYGVVGLIEDGWLGPLWRFELEYCDRDSANGAAHVRDPAKLRERLAPIWLRRHRFEVAAELPDRTEKSVLVGLPAGRQSAVSDLVQRWLNAHGGAEPFPGGASRKGSAEERVSDSLHASGLHAGPLASAELLAAIRRASDLDHEGGVSELTSVLGPLAAAHGGVVVACRNAELARDALHAGRRLGLPVATWSAEAWERFERATGPRVMVIEDAPRRPESLLRGGAAALVHFGIADSASLHAARYVWLGPTVGPDGEAGSSQVVTLCGLDSLEEAFWRAWTSDPAIWADEAPNSDKARQFASNWAATRFGTSSSRAPARAPDMAQRAAEHAEAKDWRKALECAVLAYAWRWAEHRRERPPTWPRLWMWTMSRQAPVGWLPEGEATLLVAGLALSTSDPLEPAEVLRWVARAQRGPRLDAAPTHRK